jgi:hypothetical protein
MYFQVQHTYGLARAWHLRGPGEFQYPVCAGPGEGAWSDWKTWLLPSMVVTKTDMGLNDESLAETGSDLICIFLGLLASVV